MFLRLEIPFWNSGEHIANYRIRRSHRPVKGTQLDLFNLDDGWEYSVVVVATNKDLGLLALCHFMNGRGVHEQTLAELKSGFAYDQIPTRDWQANTGWQKLNLLAQNINIGFQVDLLDRQRARTAKCTASFAVSSIRTLRFEWLNRAARLVQDPPPGIESGRRKRLYTWRDGARSGRVECHFRANTDGVCGRDVRREWRLDR